MQQVSSPRQDGLTHPHTKCSSIESYREGLVSGIFFSGLDILCMLAANTAIWGNDNIVQTAFSPQLCIFLPRNRGEDFHCRGNGLFQQPVLPFKCDSVADVEKVALEFL